MIYYLYFEYVLDGDCVSQALRIKLHVKMWLLVKVEMKIQMNISDSSYSFVKYALDGECESSFEI